MKRDIRHLFKEEVLEPKKLPVNHRNEFLQKLENSKTTRKKTQPSFLLKIVATVVLVLSVSYFVFNPKESVEKQPLLVTQIQQMEKEYVKNIDKEWNNFLQLTNDKKLINYYEKKLKVLSAEYEEIAIQFKEEPNNIIVLEKLISNLNIRLETLKEIQNHLKSLTPKNQRHETIII